MTSPAFSRKATPSPLRRISQCVLAAGAVLAVAAAFGPIWVVRSGIALAVITAVVACVYAWREVAETRRAAAKKTLATSQAHGAALTEERRHNASVVQTLSERVDIARAEVEMQRVGMAKQQSTISTLNGERAHLKAEVQQHLSTITSLEDTVRVREAELLALRDEDDGADVHALPRRGQTATDTSVEADAEDVWGDDDHPTVVDMKTLSTAMVMPNYEEERKQA